MTLEKNAHYDRLQSVIFLSPFTDSSLLVNRDFSDFEQSCCELLLPAF
jgi:hypothetical protein